MNKAYRVVWNAAHACFVVAHEKSKAHGAPSTVRNATAAAVAAACLALGATDAMAADACTVSANTVSGSITDNCTLSGGDSLYVTPAGSIAATSGNNAVDIDTGTVTRISNDGQLTSPDGRGINVGSGTGINAGITNSGQISGSTGVHLDTGTTLSGGIANSGTISGAQYGIRTVGAYLDRIENSANGSIRSSAMTNGYAAISVSNTSSLGSISNSGTISGVRLGIETNASTTSSIMNLAGGLMSVTSDRGQIIANNGTIGFINNIGTLLGTGTVSNNDGAGGSALAANSMAIANYLAITSVLNSGLISMSGTSATGLYNGSGATIGTVTNTGRILVSGEYSAGVDNAGTLTSLTNSGTISASGTASNGVYNAGTLSSLVNGGGYIGGDRGVYNTGAGTINSLTNSATIAGAVIGVRNRGTINGLINTGGITGTVSGIAVENNGNIVSLSNSGVIMGGTYSISVDSGATIGSLINQTSGRLSGDLNLLNTSTHVNNAGTIRLASTGTSIIAGNFSQSGTGILSLNVAGMSSYSRLSVGGTASLGGTLQLRTGGADLSNGTLSGVIQASTVSGAFTTVSGANSLFSYTADYTGTDVNVVIAPKTGYQDAAANAGNTPAYGAAYVLDTIAGSNALNPVVLSFADVPQDQISSAIGQTLPLFVSAGTVAAQSALGSFGQVVQARIESNLGMSTGDGFYGDKQFWMKPFGSRADQDKRDGVSGFTAHSGGAVFGADATLSDRTRVGLALAYARTEVSSSGSAASNSADIDLYQLAGYGSYSLDADTELNFQADIGTHRTKGQRKLAFGSTQATARSSYRSLAAHVGVGIARSFVLSGQTRVTPALRLDYTRIRDEGYSESGAGALDLRVKARTAESLVLLGEGKLAHQLDNGVTLLASLGVGYDAKAERTSVRAAYAGAADLSFVTEGVKPEPWLVRGGLGIATTLASGTELSARYDVEHRTGFDNQTLSAKLRWSF